jgi:hypothetical protein
VLLVSIAMSWVGVKLHRARNQLRAATAITKAGGSVGYVDADTNVPQWLQQLVGKEFFRDLVRVSLAGTRANDTVLEHLDGVTTVRTLYLDGTQATDAGLEHLDGLANLRTLRLDGTLVTEEGVQRLRAALPRCKVVNWDPSDAAPGRASRLSAPGPPMRAPFAAP